MDLNYGKLLKHLLFPQCVVASSLNV